MTIDSARPGRILDVAIVGAGPAGLNAATSCAKLGLATTLFDEQSHPGGQVFRNVTASPVRTREIFDDEYWQGESLVRAFEASGAGYVRGASVWAATRHAGTSAETARFDLGISTGAPGARRSELVSARALIIATGTHERPFPIPGWTLPGVMGAGAAQLLLKSSALVPDGSVVLAGNGPLLWLLAAQYLKAGIVPDALLDTTPRGRYAEAAAHAWGFMRSDYFVKGLKLFRDVRPRLRVIEHVTALAAEGTSRVEVIRYEVDSRVQSLPVDLLLLHQGVVPNVNLSNAVGCKHRWNEAQRCFDPVVDAWGASTVPNVFIAGDAAGVAGWQAAEAGGGLVALGVATALGRINGRERDLHAADLRETLDRAKRGRRFFETLYCPPDAFRLPRGETIACRCEEVTAQQIDDAVRAGSAGPNQLKAFTRCGMGPCQGRFCGLTVSEMIARARGVTPAQVGAFRQRFPVRPITLGELASLPADEAAVAAVDRVGRATGGH